MKYLSWLGVASVLLIATGCASTANDTGTSTSSPTYDGNDFKGEWQLVVGRSENGRDWFDERTRFGEDEWGTTTRTDDRIRYRAWFLPDVFRIDGGRQVMRIEDESGEIIAEVPFDDDYRYGASDDPDYDERRRLRTRWINDRRFEVERWGRNGRRITQTFMLENRGRQLSVSTEVERDGNTRTYTRVYERA